jgi:hypothetical protein
MKNKLMRTTALVGSMIILGTGVSVAQTTISGNLDLSFKAVEAQTAINSHRGFGKESQINLANKGKLNNGMDYAAGFSLEYDGSDTGAAGTHGEGVYINFISGNTTFHVGADHIQNPDSHGFINPVGVGYITHTTATTSAAGETGLYPMDANSPYAAYGFGLVQAVPGFGNLSFFYAPTDDNAVAAADIGNVPALSNYENTRESAMEVGFRGDLGVKGLQVAAFVNRADAPDTYADQSKEKGQMLGASYNLGQITIGLDHRKVDQASSGEDIKAKAIALSFAATKELSFGATYGKAESNLTTNPEDEKTKLFAVGYNLGPVALNAQYLNTENVDGVGSVDTEQFIIKASTKF